MENLQEFVLLLAPSISRLSSGLEKKRAATSSATPRPAGGGEMLIRLPLFSLLFSLT
jgi:hypothetical protein